MTGGVGFDNCAGFLRQNHFIGVNRLTRTGAVSDRRVKVVVAELVAHGSRTPHTIDWMLHGDRTDGRFVEIPLVEIV